MPSHSNFFPTKPPLFSFSVTPHSLIAVLHIMSLPSIEVFAQVFISSSLAVSFGFNQVFWYGDKGIRDSKQEGWCLMVCKKTHTHTRTQHWNVLFRQGFQVYAKRREIQGAQSSAIRKASSLKELGLGNISSISPLLYRPRATVQYMVW